MKNLKYLVSLFVALMILIAAATLLVKAARGEGSGRGNNMLKLLGVPNATMSNVNRVAAWYSANGEQERTPGTGNSGLYFPRGTTTAIYSAGLIWGGLYNDGRAPVLRVNGQSYNNGTKPGAILGIRTGVAEDPAALDVRIWRVRRDYATADLRQDAAEINSIAISAVTDADVQAVRDQYEKDWREWPWQKGAPFYDIGYLDVNGDTVGRENGILDRGEDLNQNGVLDLGEDLNGNGILDGETPGIADAEQVIWYVCNDIAVAQPWACPESGMEEQTTIWAYDRADALGNVIFKRFRLIYKGVAATPANATIDSMYMCQWSDPDLGTFTDDFVGCDTLLSLGYVYNATANDGLYSQFGLVPPAAGYDFLQGPIVPGAPTDSGIFDLKRVYGRRNLPMTSFIYFAAGGTYSDPPFNYNGAIQWYQMLRGLPPTPQGPPDPPRLINPVTGQPTSFWLSGDPVMGTGWIDGNPDGPGDRRMLLTSGPFTMAVGDTQELVSAFVAGLGTTRLKSIQVMKFNDRSVQLAYDNLFDLPKAPPAPNVRVLPFSNRLLLDWEFDSVSVGKTENTVGAGGYTFEGYKVYQFPSPTADISAAELVAKFDLVNGVRVIFQEEFDPVTGEILILPVQLGEDNGIKRTLAIDRDLVRSRPFVNGQLYYFAVTAYNYTTDATKPIRTLESAARIVSAVPEDPRPGTYYPYSIGDTVSVRNELGVNDAAVYPVVYNPAAQTGGVYHLTFDTSTAGALRWTLLNITTGRTIHSNISDLTGSSPFRVQESGFDLFVGPPPTGMKSVFDNAGRNVFGTGSQDPTYAVFSINGSTGALEGRGKSGRNFEIRFDGTGSYVVRTRTGPLVQHGVYRAPFSAWDLGRAATDTPKQVIAFAHWDGTGGTENIWNIDNTPLVLSGIAYSVFERISITTFLYPGSNDSASIASNIPLKTNIFTAGNSDSNHVNSAVYKVFIADLDDDQNPPPVGTSIRFNKFLEIQYGDIKSIAPQRVIVDDIARAKQEVARINAFPNPYYGLNRAETDRNVRFITFNHLPQRAVIRIFNLAGTLVRTIEKNDAGQFQRWDLQNNNGLPVASGIYIIYIEMPDLGETKTLKVAIIQEQQFLRNY